VWRRGLREEGQAAIEYGILAAAIVAVCVAVIQVLGAEVESLFNSALAAF
jgi:Flp pilus assembly pilin Flp